MRRLLVPTRFLLVSFLVGPLACGSSDPEAAAKAAKSAGGALEKLSPVPDKGEIDPKLPDGPGLPGKPGDYKPPPVEAGATCITDDDPPTTTENPPSQKIPPKTPKLPGQPLDPSAPKVEGTSPKSASSAPSGGKELLEPAIGNELGGTKRSATSSTSTTTVQRPLDYASLCETKMSDDCSTFCTERGLTWDRSAGNNGTCFSLSSSTSEGSLSTYQCGCMCK